MPVPYWLGDLDNRPKPSTLTRPNWQQAKQVVTCSLPVQLLLPHNLLPAATAAAAAGMYR